MSGTFPSLPGVTNMLIETVYANVRSQTLTGRTQVRQLGGQWFRITVKFNNLKRSDFRPIDGFLAKQKGGAETFQFVLPEVTEESGNHSGTVSVNGAHSVGDSTINVDGFSGTLSAGGYIKFANQTKIYKITDDRSGPGDLSIEPPLINNVINNEVVSTDGFAFTVRQDGNVQEVSYGTHSRATFEIDLVEAI